MTNLVAETEALERELRELGGPGQHPTASQPSGYPPSSFSGCTPIQDPRVIDRPTWIAFIRLLALLWPSDGWKLEYLEYWSPSGSHKHKVEEDLRVWLDTQIRLFFPSGLVVAFYTQRLTKACQSALYTPLLSFVDLPRGRVQGQNSTVMSLRTSWSCASPCVLVNQALQLVYVDPDRAVEEVASVSIQSNFTLEGKTKAKGWRKWLTT